jgi:hypothetical protein
MGDIPEAALTAAAVAIHDADCPDTHCSGPALGHCYRLAEAALGAAGPHLLAAERERIRQAIGQHSSACSRGVHVPWNVIERALEGSDG